MTRLLGYISELTIETLIIAGNSPAEWHELSFNR